MRLLDALASAFIDTFGITQPSEQTRRRASWFILGLLVVAMAIVVAVGLVLYHFMHS
jgi:hypothetical protein